jgi:hypothetical protein
VLGAGANAIRTNSLALGTSATVNEFSTAIGQNANAGKSGGVAFGSSTIAG